jgi:hypothetical protein
MATFVYIHKADRKRTLCAEWVVREGSYQRYFMTEADAKTYFRALLREVNPTTGKPQNVPGATPRN